MMKEVAALISRYPKHSNALTQAVAGVGALEQVAAVFAAKCDEFRIVDVPNPFPVGDERRDAWNENFGAPVAAEPETEAPAQADDGDATIENPDYSSMTKAEIAAFIKIGTGIDLSTRQTKEKLIAAARRAVRNHNRNAA